MYIYYMVYLFICTLTHLHVGVLYIHIYIMVYVYISIYTHTHTHAHTHTPHTDTCCPFANAFRTLPPPLSTPSDTQVCGIAAAARNVFTSTGGRFLFYTTQGGLKE
jgi:hypothetical protein